jgi:acyl dehydratase
MFSLDALGRAAATQTFHWTDRDYLLYALALGMGDPATQEALPFVFEQRLRVVPTFPTVLAWIAEPTFAGLGAAPDFALHSGQKIEIHRHLTEAVDVTVTGRVIAAQDKGRERGAVIVVRQEIADARDGTALATLTTSCFARDSGGCGSGGEALEPAHTVPTRDPDQRVRYQLRPDAALLYRLTGDRNPLHADPVAAQAGGFTQPILHGLCTFGMTCRAVLERVAAWLPDRIVKQEARFSAPVYPGETLEVVLWRDGPIVSFEAGVPERGVKVLTSGKAVLR